MATQKSKRRSHLFFEFHKRGIVIVQEQNDLISLSSGAGNQKPILVRVVNSPSRIKSEHQSHNNSPVKSIGVFQIPISTDTKPDYYILTFSNKTDGKAEFVIIQTTELFRRFELFDHFSGDTVLLVLWLMEDNRLYDATNIGIEGEWYYIGGGMAKGTGLDFTGFMNHWCLLSDERNPVSQPEKN